MNSSTIVHFLSVISEFQSVDLAFAFMVISTFSVGKQQIFAQKQSLRGRLILAVHVNDDKVYHLMRLLYSSPELRAAFVVHLVLYILPPCTFAVHAFWTTLFGAFILQVVLAAA